MQRLEDVIRQHVPAGHVVEPGIVALADQRDEDVMFAADPGELVDHPLHGGVADLPDAERVGEEDGRLHQAPFDELRHAAHFARAVQHEPAADEPLLEDVLLVGEDGGDARPHRPLPAPQRACAADDGGMADQDAFHVGDGVPLPGPEAAQGNPQLPGAVPLLGPG